MKQIAQNNGRFYRVDMRQMRYFPISRAVAELSLANGNAVEVPYMPFGRGDIQRAWSDSQALIAKVQS